MTNIIEKEQFVDEETTADDDKMNLWNAVSENGAIITDSHIVYTSGRHGSTYLNKDALYQDPTVASLMGKMLAEKFKEDQIEAVVGPALGGIILSQWTAYHLGELTRKKISSVYAEKVSGQDGGRFEVKRGYDDLIAGKKILLVEDIVTTGSSVFKLRDAVKNQVSEIVGLGLICNRGNVDFKEERLGKIHSLLNLNFESWDEDDCQLCQKEVPLNLKFGKGKQFEMKKRADHGIFG
jgi:orotate phosphoribosyltransferase